jgi:uncharacterized protein (UPF0335 family)
MPRLAKKETEEAAPTPTNSQIKEYVKRLRAVNAEIKDFTDSRKDLLAEAKGNGVNIKDLKAAVKELDKPVEQDHKEGVNWILETNGQSRLFA